MKLLSEYLEHAITFERMASQESSPEVRTQFEMQAVAYRRLAAERAAKYGLPPPSQPETPNSFNSIARAGVPSPANH